MFNEEKSGWAGIFTSTCALPISSLVRPDISVPNNSATGCVAACCNNSGIASRGVLTSMEISRNRAVIAAVYTTPCKASSIELHSTASRSTSSAPAAIASACGSGKRRGLIRYRWCKPMVFIARAAAPMLPGWVVWLRTTRTFKKGLCLFKMRFQLEYETGFYRSLNLKTSAQRSERSSDKAKIAKNRNVLL